MHCHKNYYNLQQEQHFHPLPPPSPSQWKYEHAQNTKITNRDPDLTTFHHQFLYLDKMLTFVRGRERESEQDDVMRSEVKFVCCYYKITQH